ncbi:MAG: UDP-N-acetylglucosamine 2-epimerase (non-hydrolyzing) [Saprospirales bacterium]|jgi:UDP-N-acetylglucosamine 2-epimerase (non-hydrolysing)|nr:UDP-N-acetylglucosamine 2-epimerase (non-hydrolyzing) [Saprospirales bacterium]MBK8922245.1 UDP-N-acetylglucosamine 2-epimerase (non-hydrolyzing) [Saprospirales bacterium]
MKITLIAGVRPNFIKAAPLWHALQRLPGTSLQWINTGQHRDPEMSAGLFAQLGLPAPDHTIAGNTPTPVQETARIALGLEPILEAQQPDWVLVIGDVTSTLAAALAAKQSGFRVAHVEAGLRSGNRQMPEELNRIAVDHLADLLFPSEPSGIRNLDAEGIPASRVHFVGNVLIDALCLTLPVANRLNIEEIIRNASIRPEVLALPSEFALFTFHRPTNVDSAEGLLRLIECLERALKHIPVLFPVHPRTLNHLRRYSAGEALGAWPNLYLLRPLAYAEIIALLTKAKLVVTDSGGIQEESTWLGKPCLTFRQETERPATVEYGTNTLVADLNPATLEHLLMQVLAGRYKTGAIPPLWDGHAAERMAGVLDFAGS